MDIQELFQEDTDIPSLPEMFYQFQDAIDDPVSSFDEIGEIIGNDPGLTDRILKILNSDFFGLSQKIETISHATSIIGREQLSDLVLATIVMDQFKNGPQSSLNIESFWKHSIACGLSAQNLALVKGETNLNRFFLAGLLHDVGCLVISLKLPFKLLEVSLRCKSKGESLHESEFEVLGFNHADVGGCLMRAWKLPKAIEEAVGFHHNPARAPEFTLEASMINAAEAIANNLDLGFQYAENSVIPTIDEYASERLQVPKDSLFPNIRAQVQKEFDQVAQIFLEPENENGGVIMSR